MNIAFDIRPLITNQLTGIGEYTINLLTNILKLDTKNTYFLFQNSLSKKNLPESLLKDNTKYCEFFFPNKIFNGIIATKNIHLDSLIKKKYHQNIDLFFFPNIISFSSVTQNCPMINTVHDISFTINPSWYSIKRKLSHKIIAPKSKIEQSAHIITISKNSYRDLCFFYNVQPEKISIIPLGIPDQFKKVTDIDQNNSFKKKYNLSKPFILTLSTIEPRKNINSIITAFNNLPTDHDLVITGGYGWKYKRILNEIKKSPKKNKIHLIGYIKNHEKPLIYSNADLFIFPSFYEGFGLPPIEAIYCGCPVIASANGTHGEIIGNHILQFNSYHKNQLTDLLTVILTDKSLYKKLLEKTNSIKKDFSWETHAKETIKLFTTVASSAKKYTG